MPVLRAPTYCPIMATSRTTTHERFVVLVVDDNEAAADSLAQWLRLSGHQVEVAYSGLSAVECARACRPDVIICDLGLPEISGYEVARAVRQSSGATIRLVALTGYARPDEVSRCLECGFDAHVAKPAPPEYIERILHA
jgi:CheY-like chemotaxis protein